MRLSTLFLPVFAVLAAAQSSSGSNPFKVPAAGYSFNAGTPTTINWTPTTSGTVTLRLRDGASSDLNAGTVIACK